LTLTGAAFLTAAANGGALYVGDLGVVNATNCTFSENIATYECHDEYVDSGSALFIDSGSPLVLTNSVLANSRVTNCFGAVTSNGHNLSGDGTCFSSGGTDLLNTAPRLARLASYGAPTQADRSTGEDARSIGFVDGCDRMA